MSGHSRRCIVKLSERIEVLCQVVERVVQTRQVEMRINRGPAMSGKMFDAGAYSLFDILIDHRFAKVGYN